MYTCTCARCKCRDHKYQGSFHFLVTFGLDVARSTNEPSEADDEVPDRGKIIQEFQSILPGQSYLNWDTSGKIVINIQITRSEEVLYGNKGQWKRERIGR